MSYRVKCTRKCTGETWFAYDGNVWTNIKQAEAEVRACTKQWGSDVTFEVEPLVVLKSV